MFSEHSLHKLMNRRVPTEASERLRQSPSPSSLRQTLHAVKSKLANLDGDTIRQLRTLLVVRDSTPIERELTNLHMSEAVSTKTTMYRRHRCERGKKDGTGIRINLSHGTPKANAHHRRKELR